MYQVVTLEVFKKKLKSGDYQGPTGALRALGRVQSMSKADKKAAVAAVERHYKTKAKSKKG